MASPDKSKNKRLRILKPPAAGDKQAQAAVAIEKQASNSDPVCPKCFGTGLEIVLDQGARRCDCQTDEDLDRLIRAAKIPRRYQACTLANYDAGVSDSMWIAKREAQIVFEEFLELDGRGLLFIGPVGVGKTHLAVAILLELIHRYRIRGLFYQFGALLKEIQGSYNTISETSELAVLRPVFDADVLVLDELGSQKMTEWVRETLMYIINSRYNDKRLTIFTTNYSDDSQIDSQITDLNKKLRELQNLANQPHRDVEYILTKMKSLTEGTLESRIGTPLRSRLYEMCKAVTIEGDDYRKANAAGRRS